MSIRKGPLYMLLASLSFTVMVALVKVARSELPALEIVFWRAVVSGLLLWPLVRQAGYRLRQRGVFLLRLILGFAAMLCFYTAAKGLPLANFTLITKLQPLEVALLAPLFLGHRERAEPFLWMLMATSLAGCALLLAPEAASGSWYGLWAVAASLLSAGAHLALRQLGSRESTRAVVFWFHVGLVGLSLGALLATQGRLPLPPPHLWPVVLGTGVAATVGQLFLTQAYSEERAAVVAAASYSSPLWALAIDLVFFRLVPGWNVYVGGALVIIPGLWLLVRRREPATSGGKLIE